MENEIVSKIPVWRITLDRNGHRSEMPGKEPVVSYPLSLTVTAEMAGGVWALANRILRGWMGDPSHYKDGHTFQVRYELLFFDSYRFVGEVELRITTLYTAEVNLAQIVLLSLHTFAGEFRPANFNHARYSQFLTAEEPRRKMAALILDRYDFGEEFVRPPSGTQVAPSDDDLAPSILSYLEGREN